MSFQACLINKGDLYGDYIDMVHPPVLMLDYYPLGQVTFYIARIPENGPTYDDAGFVVKRLKANTEQCRRDNSEWAWRGDSQCDWIIKPRIRIDSIEQYTNKDVCRIIVLNQNRDTLKNLIIKANNFTDGITLYRGQYLEEFFNLEEDLIIHGDWCKAGDPGNSWNFVARGDHDPDRDYDNHADIQVWWYGNCDMWIDYVRVDNDIADQLFKGYFDNPIYGSPWLLWEAEDIACSGGDAPWRFYTELFEFNQIPCMSYVNRHLRNYNSNIGLMCDLNWSNYNTVIPFSSWEHQIVR
jgi:hypothetical protein